MFRPAANPGQAIERHFEAAAELDRQAAEHDANGLHHIARLARRSAAGHRAAITRIAKALEALR